MKLDPELLETIKADYMTSTASIRSMALKYKIPTSTMGKIAKEEQWAKQRDAFRAGKLTETNCGHIQEVYKSMEERASAIRGATDKLLGKITQLIELDEPLAPRDLKAMTGAIIDLKVIYDLRTPEQIRETEARIKTLEKSLEDDDKQDKNIQVEFVGLDEWFNKNGGGS